MFGLCCLYCRNRLIGLGGRRWGNYLSGLCRSGCRGPYGRRAILRLRLYCRSCRLGGVLFGKAVLVKNQVLFRQGRACLLCQVGFLNGFFIDPVKMTFRGVEDHGVAELRLLRARPLHPVPVPYAAEIRDMQRCPQCQIVNKLLYLPTGGLKLIFRLCLTFCLDSLVQLVMGDAVDIVAVRDSVSLFVIGE